MLGDRKLRGKVRDGVTSVFQAEHRTMTAFILAVIVNNYNTGQVSAKATLCPCRGVAQATVCGVGGLLL